MPDRAVESMLSELGEDQRVVLRTLVQEIAELGVPDDLQATVLGQILPQLNAITEIDRVLGCLGRFLQASRSPLATCGLFEREPDALASLLRLFSVSQYLADLIVQDPEAFDLVRITNGQPVELETLRDEIVTSIRTTKDHRAMCRVLREYRHRETLRIAYGDFVNDLPVETVFEQISILAEAIIEAAVEAAHQEMSLTQLRRPSHPGGEHLRFSVIALGKLGGAELNYSSDVDLIFVREAMRPSPTWQRTEFHDSEVEDYFQRLAQKLVNLLSASTPDGFAYRVDTRLRPHGRSGPLVVTYRDALDYYDSAGRTWERQAFIKARPVAGDLAYGQKLIDDLQPWIYRRYLMRADITGLVALKRRIERRATATKPLDLTDEPGTAILGRNIKIGYGGIRDIEYGIQFLQLLHGAEQPTVRCPSTMEAIQQLANFGCLTVNEQVVLAENYRYLRWLEHRLQIMFDRQIHSLPNEQQDLNDLAIRCGYGGEPEPAGAALMQEVHERTHQNRQILDHLMQNAFASVDYDENQLANAESDLVLDPEPAPETIEATLAPYGFTDSQAAYRILQELAVESIAFLSSRRSRHFLAAIAPKLLKSISQTPNPDATLINLARVSASLGGKAVLWELFSANPPTMELCLRLCACSPYLASILTSAPGMIDELLDSLMLGHLPTREELSQELDELCRGAIEIAPILYSFKNSMHLRVGVRDILGKSTIDETHRALADIAEVCMEQVIHHEFHRLVHKLGLPTKQQSPHDVAAELVVIAVGKLGGREPNYHSDLDVIFLFEDEGSTRSLTPNRRFEATTNRHFFNQLCQRVVHAVTSSGTTGKLYDLDVRLRPLGKSGQLAITFDDLRRYFESGHSQVWERQALCKARPIWGSSSAKQRAMTIIQETLQDTAWSPEQAEKIYAHRLQLQHGAALDNLKRGLGGTMDIEFVVQLLQLVHVGNDVEVLEPGTLNAIQRLESLGFLQSPQATRLFENYQFLRSVESAIRLMNLSARHELPKGSEELAQLAFLLRSRKRLAVEAEDLAARCEEVRTQNREIFESTFQPWLPAEVSE